MCLNHFNTATTLIEMMKDGPQYVRVTAGPRIGTIGRVLEVKSKYFSSHDYRLSVQGRKSFWVKGGILDHLKGYQGSTVYQIDRSVPQHHDLMGRVIEMGHTVLFPRSTEGAKVDMVLGTVKRISPKGTIYAKLFHNSQGSSQLASDLVRIGKPSSSLVIDTGTVDKVILAKLSQF